MKVELVGVVSGASDSWPVSIKIPGAGLPGVIVPPVALIAPTVPLPPRTAP